MFCPVRACPVHLANKSRPLISAVLFHTHNLGYDILEFYNVFVESPVRVATRKTKLDTWYNKLAIRVASKLLK